MPSAPSVSVVIPAYNSKFLEETISSVYAQTLPPDQVIVVDDGSTDDTAERLGRLAARLPTSFIWRTKENGGEASARNLCLELATGTHVAFLDHDDLWHPEKIERQLEHFGSDPDLALSFTAYEPLFRGYQHTPGRSRQPETLRHEYWDTDSTRILEELLFGTCPIGTLSTVMMRRDAVAEVTPFDERLVLASDILMYLEVAVRGIKIDYLPEVLVEYRWHGSNNSRDWGAMWEQLCAMYDSFFRRHNQILPAHIRLRLNYWRAHRHLQTAIDARLRGDRRRAGRHLLAAARAEPKLIRPGWVRILGLGPAPNGPWPT